MKNSENHSLISYYINTKKKQCVKLCANVVSLDKSWNVREKSHSKLCIRSKHKDTKAAGNIWSKGTYLPLGWTTKKIVTVIKQWRHTGPKLKMKKTEKYLYKTAFMCFILVSSHPSWQWLNSSIITSIPWQHTNFRNPPLVTLLEPASIPRWMTQPNDAVEQINSTTGDFQRKDATRTQSAAWSHGCMVLFHAKNQNGLPISVTCFFSITTKISTTHNDTQSRDVEDGVLCPQQAP